MELEVLSEKKNDLYSRREIVVKMKVEKETPARKEVMKAIQSHFAAAESEIVIDRIEQPFGTKSVKVHLKIYSNKEESKNEPKYKGERGKAKQKPAEAAK
jgi:ribosomal protein S24E